MKTIVCQYCFATEVIYERNFYSASQHQLLSLVIVLGVILKFLI